MICFSIHQTKSAFEAGGRRGGQRLQRAEDRQQCYFRNSWGFMKTVFVLLLIYFLTPINTIYAQSTFTFSYMNAYVKQSYTAIEDEAGNVITLITEHTGTDYTPTQYYRAGIMTFSPLGDTNTVFYDIGDTVFSLLAMSKDEDAGYILSGHAGLPVNGSSRLLLIKTDSQKLSIWIKQYPIEGILNFYPSKIFADENGYYVFGAVDFTIGGPWFPFLSRFDREGNLVRYFVYPDYALPEYEYCFNPTLDRIWLFAGPNLDPYNGASKAIFDTVFTYMHSEALPIHGLSSMKFRWQSDTSYYLSYHGWRNEIPNPDHELSIALYDTLMNRMSYGEFGDLDYDDYPGSTKPFDFIHPDTIFYTGTIGLHYYPIIYGYTNWIMIGQTSSNLQERYRHYYGGDANYRAWYILALKDGGCFVHAARLNEELLIYDLVYFKLDKFGQLVYTSDVAMVQRLFVTYPNPVKDHIDIEGPATGYEVHIFSLDGRILEKVNSHSSHVHLKLDSLKPGIYVLSLLIDGRKIETKKIVKL